MFTRGYMSSKSKHLLSSEPSSDPEIAVHLGGMVYGDFGLEIDSRLLAQAYVSNKD